MAVGMEANLNDTLAGGKTINGDGLAQPQPPVSADDLPALIAVRLRWDRRFRKDRSLDYAEKQLTPSAIVHLHVRYTFTSNGDTKRVFVEAWNRTNASEDDV